MKRLAEILNWLEINRDIAYSLIRIFLGFALFIRGWVFISDPAALTDLARENEMYLWYSYITIIHLIGGLSLAIGLWTRFAALVQIPILIGAVFVVHIKQGLMTVGQSLELAALVLFLLVIYLIFGSGKLAIDKYIAEKKSRDNHD